MSAVVQLHKERPCNDVAATLRRVADRIEAGEHGDWPVTTCVIVIGHTDAEVPGDDGIIMQQNYWDTYGAGPRCDAFTVRGLLQTVLGRWGWD